MHLWYEDIKTMQYIATVITDNVIYVKFLENWFEPM